jgi:hypothetical protein
VNQSDRLARIDHCMRELDRLEHSHGLPNQNDRWGVSIGELDWLEELHRLLYFGDDVLTFSHDRKETIRTVAAVIGDICAIASVILQCIGLRWIMTHPR